MHFILRYVYSVILITLLTAPMAFATPVIICAELFPFLKSANNHPDVLEMVTQNAFTVNRGISDYKALFREQFSERLYALKSGDVWIDFGSGEGVAILNFLMNHPSKNDLPTTYGITVDRPPISQLNSSPLIEANKKFRAEKKFISVEGRFIEDIPSKEIPRFNIATDYFGPLAYTHDLTYVLNKYLARLKFSPEAAIYTTGLHLTHKTSASHKYTYIIDRLGRVLNLAEWLTTQASISVKTVGNHNAIAIKKKKENAQVGELELLSIIPGAPPTRIFREVGSTFDKEHATFIDPRDGKVKTLHDALTRDVYL